VERVPSSFWFDYEIQVRVCLLYLASEESMARKVLPFPASFAQIPAELLSALPTANLQ